MFVFQSTMFVFRATQGIAFEVGGSVLHLEMITLFRLRHFTLNLTLGFNANIRCKKNHVRKRHDFKYYKAIFIRKQSHHRYENVLEMKH
jgi:hypothetical protein